MRAQAAAVYREIQRNAETGMKTIETVSDMVRDEELALQLSRKSLRYSEIYNEAARQLMEAREEGYRSNALADVLLRAGLHYNTILNTSTGHLAELMIKESANGMLELEKALRHNEGAGERPKALARQLIALEEKSVAGLKQYL